MEAAVTIGGLLVGIFSLLLMWKSRTDQLLSEQLARQVEIRDVLIEIRDTPPVINVIPRKKLDEL